MSKKITNNIGVTRRKWFATPPSDTSTNNYFTPTSLDVPNTPNIACKKQNSWWGVRMQKKLQESLDVVNLIAMNEDKEEMLRPNKKDFITRHTPKQVNRNNKKEKKFKFCYDTKYKQQLKLATNCHRHNLEKKTTIIQIILRQYLFVTLLRSITCHFHPMLQSN